MQIPPEATRHGVYGRRERLAMLAGGVLMLAIVAAGVLIARQTARDTIEVGRTLQVRRHTAQLMQAVLSAETSQRGYMLTRRDIYLRPYAMSVQRVPGMLATLQVELAREPAFPVWRKAVLDKMAELSQTVRLAQSGQYDAALALVMTDRGNDDMQLVRSLSESLVERQSAIVAEAIGRSERNTRLLVWVDTLALVQLLALAAFIGRNLARTVRALSRSGAELAVANAALQAGRDRLEAAVAERTAELTEANEEVQRFAYIVSHDLRAPLLNIIGFTAELQDATDRLSAFVTDHLEPAGIVVPADVREASRDDLPEAIRFIRTSTAKMDRLITAILRLAREGRRVLVPEPLDMAGLLGGVIDSVRQIADAAGAEIVLESVPALVCDRLAMEQVFSNLVENALKYAAPGRPARIVLSGRDEGAWVRIEVADNGRGIASRDLERIFELFRRAGQQDTQGEGIGLAHVRALLRRLGGSVTCQSTFGAGSTFIVRIPQDMPAARGMV